MLYIWNHYPFYHLYICYLVHLVFFRWFKFFVNSELGKVPKLEPTSPQSEPESMHSSLICLCLWVWVYLYFVHEIARTAAHNPRFSRSYCCKDWSEIESIQQTPLKASSSSLFLSLFSERSSCW